MVRVALWLLQEVGEGNVFTKADLRNAFPGVEQVDRRMRDLRVRGWRIGTNTDDASLTPNELRFAQAGDNVWEAGKARPSDGTLTSKSRKAIFERDHYLCVSCGVGGGETYADTSYDTAQLGISVRREETGGVPRVSYFTECGRCRAGGNATRALELEEALRIVERLSGDQRSLLSSWIRRGQRSATSADQVWAIYRRLSDADRKAIADAVDAPR
ncbi:hypothetical protein [Actinoplanes sp. NBRC 103695]|uniref:hypothetical protein n=1 Tax=Actinoplanes sp. NBRC 103695 TaxID=3032202 RepID=UPI002555F9BC|nr:hypothetical protein [Actinoplanes sp. NBRC 103695]